MCFQTQAFKSKSQSSATKTQASKLRSRHTSNVHIERVSFYFLNKVTYFLITDQTNQMIQFQLSLTFARLVKKIGLSLWTCCILLVESFSRDTAFYDIGVVWWRSECYVLNFIETYLRLYWAGKL